MKAKQNLLPVKKVLTMINSCENETQLNRCKSVIENYVKCAQKTKLANVIDLKNRLEEEFLQKQESLYLVKIFNA